MTKTQSTATIVFATLILIFAAAGQAKFGALILAVAMIASVATILYDLANNARKEKSPFRQFDWNS